MHTTNHEKAPIGQAEVEQVFAELDHRHFAGRLSAVGYVVKVTSLQPGHHAQCHWWRKLILIDPQQVERGDDLRGVLLHEMAHAVCYREVPSGRPHRRPWQRELTRLYLHGEWCVARELFILRRIWRGVLPTPPVEYVQYMLRTVEEKREREGR